MPGLKDFAQRIRRVQKSQERLLDELGEAWVKEAKRNAKSHWKFAKDIKFVKDSPTSGRLVMAKQGGYLEHGTKPHEIRPKNKQSLAFPASGGGHWGWKFRFKKKESMVFVKKVQHPGTTGTHFIQRAWESSRVQRKRKILEQFSTISRTR